ncbi:mitochondrial branched-chain alpha-ketoacid dehydrogenase kinase-domain-containing protein [Mycena olivaceomarginata]|nr:mitochondrial branched-chain alpha-ketoacid dehydrogenase kinase-domain-containing protein [Mycena olivaceomarginata]
MSAGFRISSALWDRIHHFASFPQTGVSLQQMVLFGQNPSQGTLLKASQFLAEELPVRLAHRVKELDELPHNLSAMPSINKVKNWYAQSFEELISFPAITLPPDIRQALMTRSEDVTLPESTPNPSLAGAAFTNANGANGNGFNKLKLRVPMERRYYANTRDVTFPPETLDTIKSRHDPTVTTVAQGVLEWKKSQKASTIGLDIQAWLDRFYLSRIGIRADIALNTQQAHPDYVGIICTKANIHDIVEEAIENARFVCEEHYAMFNHICFELLKNSLRAVVERYGVDNEDAFPPIKVVVVEGREDITIKISDEGGGIPRSAIPLIWTYMYTTMEGQGIDQDFHASDFRAPMAGFGYGLPLSRLYARYFGGDLRLIAMEGYGTDVYIHLNRLSSSREPLP